MMQHSWRNSEVREPRLGWLDSSNVPTNGKPGADQTQQHRAGHQGQTVDGWHASQLEVTLIQRRHLAHCAVEPDHAQRQQQPGQQTGEQPVEHTYIEERPTHEGVSAADQLDHHNLIPAALDGQTDGIDHHQQQRQHQ